MRTDIGNIMSATAILQKQMESPVQLLRKEVDIMRSELIWYEKKHPDFPPEIRESIPEQRFILN